MARLVVSRAAFFGACIATFAVGAAHAGSGNALYALQESPAGSIDGNTLTIDQSLASDSLAAGVDAGLLDQIRNGVLIGSPSPIDLTSANILSPPVATQRGEDNHATLTFTGYGGEVQLYQDVATGTPWSPAGRAAETLPRSMPMATFLAPLCRSAPTTPPTSPSTERAPPGLSANWEATCRQI